MTRQACSMLEEAFMHRDPKQEAQIAEDAGLTAEPNVVPSVAKPDVGDKGIEAAIAKEKEDAAAGNEPAKNAPPAPKPSLDRLDKERADGEGMAPLSSP